MNLDQDTAFPWLIFLVVVTMIHLVTLWQEQIDVDAGFCIDTSHSTGRSLILVALWSLWACT